MIYTIKQEAGCNKRESTPASFPPVNINEIKSFFSQDVTSIIRVTKQWNGGNVGPPTPPLSQHKHLLLT